MAAPTSIVDSVHMTGPAEYFAGAFLRVVDADFQAGRSAGIAGLQRDWLVGYFRGNCTQSGWGRQTLAQPLEAFDGSGAGPGGHMVQLCSHIRRRMVRIKDWTVLSCRAARRVRAEFDWTVEGLMVLQKTDALKRQQGMAMIGEAQTARYKLVLFPPRS